MANAVFRFGAASEHQCKVVCGIFGSEQYLVDGPPVLKHWTLSPHVTREFVAHGYRIQIDVAVRLKRVDATASVNGVVVAEGLLPSSMKN